MVRELAYRIREALGTLSIFDPLRAADVADIVYGLRSLSDEHTETLLLIDSLLPHINRCHELMAAHQWCRTLSGLQRMSAEPVVVRSLLRALTLKVGGMEVYGVSAAVAAEGRLREDVEQMPGAQLPVWTSLSERDSTTAIPSSLTPDPTQGPETGTSPSTNRSLMGRSVAASTPLANMTPQDVGNALSGISSMRGDHAEVTTILQYISDGISKCCMPHGSAGREVMVGTVLSKSVRSLRAMSSKKSDVRALVHSLARLLHRTDTPVDSLTPVHIALALRGLTRLNSYRSEVRDLVGALAAKTQLLHAPRQTSDGQGEEEKVFWSGDVLSSALYGLQCLNSDHDEVAALLRAILPFMASTPPPLPSARVAADGLQMTLAQICVALYGLKNMSNDGRQPNGPLVNSVLACIAARSQEACRHMSLVESMDGGGTDQSLCMDSFMMLPKHLSSALYGMQRLVGSDMMSNDPNHALLLLNCLIDAHFLTQDLYNTGALDDVNIGWDIPKYSGALYGLICLDFNKHWKARKFVKWLFNDIRNCEAFLPHGSRPAVGAETHLIALQKLRLYQFLLMFYAWSNTNSTLTPELQSLLYSTVTDVQSNMRLPPVTHLSSNMTKLYKNKIDELMGERKRGLSDIGLAHMSAMRHISAFYGVYLHGFLCDVVLVGYYGKWHQTMLDSSIDAGEGMHGRHQYWRHHEYDGRHEYEKYHADDDEDAESIPCYYTATPPSVAAASRWKHDAVGNGGHGQAFVNTSSQELIDFINSRNSERLVVVNLEIDGTQKDLVEAEGKSELRDHYLQTMHNVIVKRIKLSEKRKLKPTSRIIAEFDSILEIE